MVVKILQELIFSRAVVVSCGFQSSILLVVTKGLPCMVGLYFSFLHQLQCSIYQSDIYLLMIWLIIVVEQIGIIGRCQFVNLILCQFRFVEANLVCSFYDIPIGFRLMHKTAKHTQRSLCIFIDEDIRGCSFSHHFCAHFASLYLEDILDSLLEGIEEGADSFFPV